MNAGHAQVNIAGGIWGRQHEFAPWRDKRVVALLGAFTFVALASAVRLGLGRHSPAPFLPFYPAIMAATMLWGRRGGYPALAISELSGWYLVLSPREPGTLDVVDQLSLALFAGVAVVVIEILARLTSLADTLRRRLISLTEQEAMVAASLSELEALYDEAPIGLGFLDRDLRFVRVNASLAEMNGASPADHLGRSVWDIAPDLRETAEPLLRNVLESGEPLRGVELSGETPAMPGVKRDWVEMFYPVRGNDGTVEGIGIMCDEVTDRNRAAERERLLQREVDHRAKNLLAVVQSVLQLTRTASTIDEYKAAVIGRIQALGRVHTILAESSWAGARLDELIANEVAAFGPAVEVAGGGEGVVLSPGQAQAVSMILHELATNSAKHGALSGTGRVELAWSHDEGPPARVRLSWIERDGPPVAEPSRAGFGMSLIQRSVSHLLGGDLDFRLEPQGLVCRIAFPVER